LRSIFQAIDLHDLLLIEQANATELTISGLKVDTKQNSVNSVLLAHEAMERAAQRKLPAKFHLHKRIPPGSGMGGASSDAATTLKGLKSMYKLAVDLTTIATELGSDVPFFLTGGRARAEGRGERLTPLQSEPTWFAIAWPGIELKTADVYRAWDEVKGEGPNHLRKAAEHVEPRLQQFAARVGHDWQMTGSGSAFFKPTSSEEEAKLAIAKLDTWTTTARTVESWG
jgi:4-diphosphocytidyl-2-C-methyl-D-erythritol kinase